MTGYTANFNFNRSFIWYLLTFITLPQRLWVWNLVSRPGGEGLGLKMLDNIWTFEGGGGERTGGAKLIKKKFRTWFQTFAVFWALYFLFWVILQRMNFMCRRFGTPCLVLVILLVHTTWRWNRVFRNGGTKFIRRGITQRKNTTKNFIICTVCRTFLFVALLPNAGHGLLILDVF
jgi:hypothetical protein